MDGYYSSLPQYPHDVAKAKALAATAGVKGQTVVIATSPITSAADVLTQAVAQAATDIGLTPKIETISPDKYTTLFSDPAARKGIDLFFTSWYVSIGDPLDMYGVLQTGQFSNYGGWSNPDYDAAVAAAIGTADPVQRSASTAKAQQIAQDELPWLPLYTVPTTVWLGKRITGVAAVDQLHVLPVGRADRRRVVTELHYLSATDAQRRFRANELSPVELLDAVRRPGRWRSSRSSTQSTEQLLDDAYAAARESEASLPRPRRW